jgi:hypothetical protein
MFELFEFDSNKYKGNSERVLFPFGPPLAGPAKQPSNPWASGPFATGKTGEGLALAATGGVGWRGIKSESMLGSWGFDLEGRSRARFTGKGGSIVVQLG